MLPMMPMCNSQAMLMPMCTPGMPAMIPMIPLQPSPMMCAPNMNLFSTTTLTNEYDSRMYGRFRHVEREHPFYRHAPFDWYKPPKQCYNVVHEDAAVLTLDGPVPIGDFYRYYIYGEGDVDNDDDDSSSYEADEYDDMDGPSYEPRSVGYQRPGRLGADLDDIDDTNMASGRAPTMAGNYTTLNTNRRPIVPSSIGSRSRPSAYQRNRLLNDADDLDDAASVNSTYN